MGHQEKLLIFINDRSFLWYIELGRGPADPPIRSEGRGPKDVNISKSIFYVKRYLVSHMMNGHHLILGSVEDYLTGETLDDTLDERYRQNIARMLVEEKGYEKRDLIPRYRLIVAADDKKASVPVDYLIRIGKRVRMIIKYGPGSLVTRHRPALAASRLVDPQPVPVVVVTNGVDAHILDGSSGDVISSGLMSIPHRSRLMEIMPEETTSPISAKQAELESRIVYCYEVDGSCPCDDTVCKL